MAVSQTLTLLQQSQDIINNTSQVHILWKSTQTNQSYNLNRHTAYYYVSINSGEETQYSLTYTLPSKKTVTILDTVITVPHNSDGTGNIKVRTWMNTGISAGVIEKESILPLTIIPRASSMTLSGNLTVGEEVSIEITRASPSFLHKIEYSIGNISDDLAVEMTSDVSVSWTPPIRINNQITQATSDIINLKLITYDGNALIGERNYAVTIAVSPSAKPICSISAHDATELSNIYGALVQGHSKLSVMISGQTSFDSPITERTTIIGDRTYKNPSFITEEVGNGLIYISSYVTDARGRNSETQVLTLNALSYEAPTVTLSAERCTSGGTPNQEGAFMQINMIANISPLNDLNSASYTIRYKKSSETTWQEITGIGTMYTSPIIPAEPDSIYSIECTVTDDLEDTETATTVPRSYVLIDFISSGKGITFGRVATEDGFCCAMPAVFEQDFHLRTTGLELIAGNTVPNPPLDLVGTGQAIVLTTTENTYYMLSDDDNQLWIGNMPEGSTIITWQKK